MHTHWCVLVEMSMEIGMLNLWLGLLATALMKETYFRRGIAGSAIYMGKQKENIRMIFKEQIFNISSAKCKKTYLDNGNASQKIFETYILLNKRRS